MTNSLTRTEASPNAPASGKALDLLPQFSPLALVRGGASAGTVLDRAPTVRVLSGRAALFLALQQARVGRGDEVLLPAYHCPSMIEPVRWLEAVPVFYRIEETLAPNLVDLKTKLSSRSKALLAAHLFGFGTDMSELRALCSMLGLTLVEDCAHALFGTGSIGSYGDFVIASPRKFLPLFDGGALSARAPHTLPQTVGAPLRLQLQAAWNSVQTMRARRAPQRADDGERAAPPQPAAKYDDPRFGKNAARTRMAFFTRAAMALQTRRWVVQRRRDNYAALCNELAGLRGAAPLFATLPDGTAPYVLPLVVANGTRVYKRLRAEGIRLGRWDEIVPDQCPVATHYAETLLHIPCHQQLSPEQLRELARAIKTAVEH